MIYIHKNRQEPVTTLQAWHKWYSWSPTPQLNELSSHHYTATAVFLAQEQQGTTAEDKVIVLRVIPF